jgi:NADPH:quinone reductase-like Zn-dependent oxidoreductase
MKALVYKQYGPPDVLELRDAPEPAPKDREVLVRIRATTATRGTAECVYISQYPFQI